MRSRAVRQKLVFNNATPKPRPPVRHCQNYRAEIKSNVSQCLAVRNTHLSYVPDTMHPIYFLADREDSQASFILPPNMVETSVNAFV